MKPTLCWRRAARRRLRQLLLLFLFTLSIPAALAQTDAVLVGRVTDAKGIPIPSVTITVHSPTGAMTPMRTLTDAEGRYRIPALPPRNDYLVVAEIVHYARVEVGPVDLDPGKTTTVNISLIPASETSETVVVVAKGDIVDLSSTKTSTVFNSEFIAGLPIMGRTYQSILTLAPGVTDVDGDGNPNINGARDTELQTLLDGANTTDPFSGTFGMNVNIESIAEIEVITTGFPAEYSGAQGGFANIVTKSGGNDITGSFKFFYRSDLLDNDGSNNNDFSNAMLFEDLDGFQDIRPFFTLGGPIVKNRLWYFVALEFISRETPVNAGRVAFLETETGWNNFAKISWQINSNNRLAVQLSQDPRRFTGLNLRTGVSPESDFNFDQGGSVATVRWTSNISPSILLETLASRFDTSIDILPITDAAPCLLDTQDRCIPAAEDVYTLDDRTGLTHGPYFLTHRDTRRRDTLKSSLSLYKDDSSGQHNLKLGVEVAREQYTNQLSEDRVRIDDFALSSIGGGIGGGGGSSSQRFSGTIQFRDAFPEEQTRKAKKNHLGLYLQDFYKPLPNVSIQLGMRFDREKATTDGWDPFDPREEAEAFLKLLAQGRRVPVEDLLFPDALTQPGMPYDLNGDGLDDQHCRTSMDVYNNNLVTGFIIAPDGTYTLVGTPGFDVPDSMPDRFFDFIDVGGDFVCAGGSNTGVACTSDADCDFGICGIVDGVASFDPDLVGEILSASGINYGDPATGDAILFFADGNAVNEDGGTINPNCDRLGEDVLFLYTVYRRHQFDDYAGPVRFSTGVLAGTQRRLEPIEIVSNNPAPRLSISWDPWANNKTKLFAFWGRYYGTLHLASLVPELGPDPQTSVYDPNQLFLHGADAQPFVIGRFSIIQVDRDLKTPFTDEFTFGFERELSANWALSVTYINRRSRDLLQDVDINHFTRDLNGDGVADDLFGKVIPPGIFDPQQPGGIGGGSPPGEDQAGNLVAPDGLPDLFVYNPFFSEILRVGNFNSSDYESVQVVLTRRLSRQWQMSASYVWSEAVGDAEAFDSLLGDDVGTVENEFGPLAYDQTHVVKFSAVSFLPRNQVVGGIIQWSSGLPYSIIRQTSSFDSFGSSFLRTSYPTGQRNDQRNQGVWRVDLSYKKSMTWGPVAASIGVEVENLTNSDDLRIDTFDLDDLVALEAERNFGRRWQLSISMSF
ncbi:MAG: TonB-dependent receptor [Acidobacteria bacterium]|nr:MAG: TonB-dependent receptor [Acidobacteriota bacterium]